MTTNKGDMSGKVKKLIPIICLVGILLVSGCITGTGECERFCKKQGYDGFDYFEKYGWNYGYCYNIENNTLTERRYVNYDDRTCYFDEEAKP